MGTAPHLENEEPIPRIGLRLAAWYAVVFVVTSIAIVLLTYRLLAASLEERDQQLVISTLREYSERYAARSPTLWRSSSGRVGASVCSCAWCGERRKRCS